jgi:Tfp pilus assembly protein PilF
MNSREYHESQVFHDPYNPLKHYTYARVLDSIYKNSEQAREHYEYALRLNPQMAAANYWYARNVLSGHDTLLAKIHLEKAIEYAPENAEFRSFYAYFLVSHLGDYATAAKVFEAGLKLAPDSARLHLQYAFCLKNLLISSEKVKWHYHEAVRLDPNLKTEYNDQVLLDTEATRAPKK